MEENRDERMCLWLSFYEPHSPYNFPIEFAKNSDPSAMPLPAAGKEDERWIPAIFRALSDGDKRGIIASYYNSVEYLDTNIGRALEKLEQLGLADSTLVVYAGDHGYLLGDHGRFEKHMMWEEVVRTPMIIRDPRYPARTVSAMVEMIDLVPTILEALGEPPLPGAQGRSLMPLIQGKTNDHRDFVFSEYFHDNKAMVRTRDWKYIYTTGKSDLTLGYETGLGPSGRLNRLYNMIDDPRETTDVAADPANARIVQELRSTMLDVFLRTDPRASRLPDGLADEDALDWFLEPPEHFATN
jgi:arylsulfatase A-like enzyme